MPAPSQHQHRPDEENPAFGCSPPLPCPAPSQCPLWNPSSPHRPFVLFKAELKGWEDKKGEKKKMAEDDSYIKVLRERETRQKRRGACWKGILK